MKARQAMTEQVRSYVETLQRLPVEQVLDHVERQLVDRITQNRMEHASWMRHRRDGDWLARHQLRWQTHDLILTLRILRTAKGR